VDNILQICFNLGEWLSISARSHESWRFACATLVLQLPSYTYIMFCWW